MTFWCLQFLPKNEGKHVVLRYHSNKVEFIGRICFRVLLTFKICCCTRERQLSKGNLTKVRSILISYFIPIYETQWVFWCKKNKDSPNLTLIFFRNKFCHFLYKTIDPWTLSPRCIKTLTKMEHTLVPPSISSYLSNKCLSSYNTAC